MVDIYLSAAPHGIPGKTGEDKNYNRNLCKRSGINNHSKTAGRSKNLSERVAGCSIAGFIPIRVCSSQNHTADVQGGVAVELKYAGNLCQIFQAFNKQKTDSQDAGQQYGAVRREQFFMNLTQPVGNHPVARHCQVYARGSHNTGIRGRESSKQAGKYDSNATGAAQHLPGCGGQGVTDFLNGRLWENPGYYKQYYQI